MTKTNLYPNWKQASEAAKKLGIKNARHYTLTYKNDPRLHSNPRQKYKTLWNKMGGWNGFLVKKKNVFYFNWELASKAAKSLEITSKDQYKKNYRKDHRLPSKPDKIYRSEWTKRGGWYGFLNKNYLRNKYSEWCVFRPS